MRTDRHPEDERKAGFRFGTIFIKAQRKRKDFRKSSRVLEQICAIGAALPCDQLWNAGFRNFFCVRRLGIGSTGFRSAAGRRRKRAYNSMVEKDLNPHLFLPNFIVADKQAFAMQPGSIARAVFAAALIASIAPRALAAPARPAACTRIEFTDIVNAGEEWKAPIGEGWVFRVIPIAPASANYTGWDLVVDREPPAGYPDALLLATPPYHALNDREIGTTFGLRAQDAIGWNPRNFRFLTNPAAFKEGQKLFLEISQQSSAASPKRDPAVAELTRQLTALRAGAAAGKLTILDAGLAPGTADPAPFAQRWAQKAGFQSYILVPESGSIPTARGELDWIRFSIALWLPPGWKLPSGVNSSSGPCPR